MKTITGKTFSEMVLNGYRDLKNHYEKVNDLNVFPVPDGDTGTNIAATLTGGVNAMKDATVEPGVQVRVPLFIKEGERIKVDTRTCEYAERLK